MRDDIKEYPGVESLIEKVIRSFDRPEGVGIRETYIDSMETLEHATPDATEGMTFEIHKIKKERMLEFIERLLRGVFYKVFSQRVPDSFLVVPSLTLEFDETMKKRFLSHVTGQKIVSVGDGIFSYTWAEAIDSPKSSIWLLCLYEKVLFGGTIVAGMGRAVGGKG